MNPRLIAVLATVVMLGAGCGSTPAREEVLAELANETIVPGYQDLAADTAALTRATEALCTNPDASGVVAARAALTEARATWSFTEAMWVGPVMDRRSWAVIDWPIAPDEIEELIADTSIELDNERLARRIGADQRGLAAIEYVLGENDDTVVDQLSDERRCAYLTGVAKVAADEAALLPVDWTVDFNDGGPYLDAFPQADEGTLDMLVNDSLFLLEAMTDAELGRALGVTGSEANDAGITEGPLGLGLMDLRHHLDGLQLVLVGNETMTGLGPLLGEDLAQRLAQQFDAAHLALDGVDGPLRLAVIDQPTEVAEARDAMKAIQVTVATEVVSRLGVTIGFSDADGDTGS